VRAASETVARTVATIADKAKIFILYNLYKFIKGKVQEKRKKRKKYCASCIINLLLG
jgi:hypothetical protein